MRLTKKRSEFRDVYEDIPRNTVTKSTSLFPEVSDYREHNDLPDLYELEYQLEKRVSRLESELNSAKISINILIFICTVCTFIIGYFGGDFFFHNFGGF